TVSNSVVGSINTGSIGTIDQSITVLKQMGEQDVGSALKGLSEAVLKSGDLTTNHKNEIIEILSVLSREAASPKESRQRTIAAPLLEKASKLTSMAADISDVCSKLWPVVAIV